MMSFSTMLAGAFQYGLKLMSLILADTTGEGRSGLPAMMLCLEYTAPSDTASSCAAGMLTVRYRWDRSREYSSSRGRLARSVASLTSTGTLNSWMVDLPALPVGWRP